MWDFDFRDIARRLVSDTLSTTWGQPSRTRLARGLVTTGKFEDMAQHVTYATSHDVEKDDEQRLYSYFIESLAARTGTREDLSLLALDMVHSTLALTLTAAGIPMFLAGEEFADLHDTDHRDWRQKMSDPVDWSREGDAGRRELLARVRDLVGLRTGHPALHRNEVEFFGFNGPSRGFHPTFDDDGGERLFAYCRTAGQPLGAGGQVIVVANARSQDYPEVWVDWPWGFRPSLRERGGISQGMPFVASGRARLGLRPFQVRVFEV
jgi:1,4-alpha-glucan branching enzyme